jgi:hypothetical protein
MMKVQEVILKPMAKNLSRIEAAEVARMSVRNMQRKQQAYQEFGYTWLFDQRRGKRSNHRVQIDQRWGQYIARFASIKAWMRDENLNSGTNRLRFSISTFAQ